MSHRSHLEIIPLGGLGEFGMNLMVYRWGDDCVIVDAGMMFPGSEHLGVDVVIPDLSFIEDCGTLHGLVLTHGHEDHIGAVSYLLARHDIPVYGTPFTLGLVERRLTEHGMAERATLRPLPDDELLRLGPFGVEALPATHSIPQARMLVLRTPLGVVVHTADFKLDPNPTAGAGTDLGKLAEIGREGVLALLSDSTNADRPGFTPGERSVSAGIDALLANRSGKVVVTTFASHVYRLQELARLARRHDRHLAIVGASIQAHAEIAERCGLLHIPQGLRIPEDEIDRLDPQRLLVVAAGSQGEPMSALARAAVDKHRHLTISPGDLVIHSARRIPGNEKSVGRMINHLMRRGAEVITHDDAPVHTSGHAAAEELGILLRLLRPKTMIPIHGEYRQLHAHARLAVASGMDPGAVQLADSGDVIAVRADGLSIEGRVHVGRVLIDVGLDEIERAVLRDRRRAAGDGIVVPVVAVDRDRGVAPGYPEILSRGFVPFGERAGDALMSEACRVIRESLRDATPEERSDEGLLRARVHDELRRFLRRRTQRQPLVIPVIVEL